MYVGSTFIFNQISTLKQRRWTLTVNVVSMLIQRWCACWAQYRSVTWLCGCGSLILNYHPAMFGDHLPWASGNNGVCRISSNFSSNSNAEVPMLRFTNGLGVTNKIYPGNPHVMLYQLVQKFNDVTRLITTSHMNHHLS